MARLRHRGTLIPDDDLWEQHLAETVTFVTEHGRLPLQREGGKWLMVQRSKNHQGNLSEHRQARLDEALPGWRKGRHTLRARRLEQIEAFVAEHGRRPQARAKDEHERVIGTWINTQRTAGGAASRHPELAQRLREALGE